MTTRPVLRLMKHEYAEMLQARVELSRKSEPDRPASNNVDEIAHLARKSGLRLKKRRTRRQRDGQKVFYGLIDGHGRNLLPYTALATLTEIAAYLKDMHHD
jgi:hypothetical protein